METICAMSTSRLNLLFEDCISEPDSGYISLKNMTNFVKIPKDSCSFEAIFFLILQLEVFLQTEKEFHLKAQTSWQKCITLRKKYNSKCLWDSKARTLSSSYLSARD